MHNVQKITRLGSLSPTKKKCFRIQIMNVSPSIDFFGPMEERYVSEYFDLKTTNPKTILNWIIKVQKHCIKSNIT